MCEVIGSPIYNFFPTQNFPPSWFGCISQWDDWWEAEGFLPVWKPEGPHLLSWPPGNQHVGLHLRFGCLLAPHSGQVVVSQDGDSWVLALDFCAISNPSLKISWISLIFSLFFLFAFGDQYQFLLLETKIHYLKKIFGIYFLRFYYSFSNVQMLQFYLLRKIMV